MFDYGPTYSSHSKNGLPVLGNASTPSNKVKRNQNGGYIPPYGMSLLTRVYNNENNEILFAGEDDGHIPARLVSEDFTIANILMLLDDRYVHWPSFDVLSDNKNERDMQNNYWDPQWLAHTDMGRTICYCYQLASALIFHTEAFEISAKDKFIEPDYYENSIEFLKVIKRLRRDYRLKNKRHYISIRPLEFACSPQLVAHKEHPEQKMIEINVHGLDFILEVRDRENNDFCVQPISLYLSRHRHAIPMLMPVFERLRQIYSLLYAVNEFKKMGYIMPDPVKKTLKDCLNEFQQRSYDGKTRYNVLPYKDH